MPVCGRFVFVIVAVYCGGQQSKPFYPYQKTYPFLRTLLENHEDLKEEVIGLHSALWKTWPDNKQESIYPMYGNGFWVESNCMECKNLYNAISTMPHLKTAFLSKRLKQEQTSSRSTYAFIADNTLRCMYCFAGSGQINVDGEERSVREKELVVYDHAKKHSFRNEQLEPQIVLLLDFSRPSWVKRGHSTNTTGISFMGHSF